MSEQPKALRLADGLEDAYPNVYTGLAPSSAAELRRLHALCEEMGEALDCLIAVYDGGDTGSVVESSIDKCRRALTKWKELK